MRFTFLSHEFPPLLGGGSSALDALTSALVRQGHGVQVISIGLGWKTTRQVDDAGKEIVRLGAGRSGVRAPTAIELLCSYLALRFLSKKWAKIFSSDVLTAFFAFPAGNAALSLSRYLALPLIVSLRGSDVPGFSDARWGRFLFIQHYILKPVWQKAFLVANGENLSSLARKFSPCHVVNLPNGVDTKIFHPSHKIDAHHELRILFVGQLIERKRILETIDAFERLIAQGVNARLSIVGDGVLAAKVKDAVGRLDQPELVDILGSISRAAMPSVYRRHDVILQLSHAEGISNVVMEALASGLCVVATQDAAGEVVTDNVSGILLDAVSTSEVTRVLAELAVDSSKMHRIQKEARGLAEMHAWDNYAKAFVAQAEKISSNG